MKNSQARGSDVSQYDKPGIFFPSSNKIDILNGQKYPEILAFDFFDHVSPLVKI